MSAEKSKAGRAVGGGRGVPWALLLLVAAGSVYAGVRWHAPIERMVAAARGTPVAGVAPSAREGGAGAPEQKQLWTCGMHPQVIQDHPGDCPICHMKLVPLGGGGATHAAGEAGGVVIDPVVVQNMGVRTAEVVEGRLGTSVRAAAMVTEAEPGHLDVNLRVSGWISTLYANTDGMTVKKGEPLFDLYSPELTLAIEELISAKRATPAADGAAGESLRATGAALVAAAETRLAALGLTEDQIREMGAMERAPKVVTIVSPLDAHVTEKTGVYSGSAVTAGQRVFRLAQRTEMWVEAQVPETQVGRVRVGQKAIASVDAFPGKTFEGEVTFIHPHFDEATRTAMVRMMVMNHDTMLHEGMYGTMEIETDDAGPVVLAPREAVIDSGDSQVVFVSAGKGRFEPRTVVMGRAGEHGMVQILSGLKVGEKVVASGQFLLDSESRLREAIAKFVGQRAEMQGAGTPGPGSSHATLVVVEPAKIDAIVAAYLPLAEALGAVQKDETPLSVDELERALRGLGEGVAPEGVKIIAGAVEAAEAMKGQPLEKQRALFKDLSATLIALVDAMPPSEAMKGTLFVVNCPMAKADWLSRTESVANPYYATDMKACGSVVRAVSVKGGPRR